MYTQRATRVHVSFFSSVAARVRVEAAEDGSFFSVDLQETLHLESLALPEDSELRATRTWM